MCNTLPTPPPLPKTLVGLADNVRLLTLLTAMSGPECCENPPAPASGDESGGVHQIASLNSYVSGNPDSKIAILLVTDVFGIHLYSTCSFFFDSPSLIAAIYDKSSIHLDEIWILY